VIRSNPYQNETSLRLVKVTLITVIAINLHSEISFPLVCVYVSGFGLFGGGI
jgi:hypothetical protein